MCVNAFNLKLIYKIIDDNLEAEQHRWMCERLEQIGGNLVKNLAFTIEM